MIVDASVAVAWFVEDVFATPARGIRGTDLRAPGMVLIETTNVLLRHVRAGNLPSEAIGAAQRSLRASIGLVDDGELLPSATRIALDHRHKLFDCLYIALALERLEPLATADKRMASIARALSIEVHLLQPD